MQQMERMTLQEIIAMLDKLNDAKCLYEDATDEAVIEKANRTFADSYDWFIQRHIAIKYDAERRLWFFAGRE